MVSTEIRWHVARESLLRIPEPCVVGLGELRSSGGCLGYLAERLLRLFDDEHGFEAEGLPDDCVFVELENGWSKGERVVCIRLKVV